MQDSSDPNASADGFRAPTGRRRFLTNAGRAVGLVALGGAWPAWRLITRNEAAAPLRRSGWAMGTSVNLSLPDGPMADNAARAAFSSLTRIQDLLSAHEASSELGRLNAASGEPVPVGYDFRAVAEAALRFADLTDGAMDVTVLPALRAYGFMPGTADASFRDRIGASHLHLSAEAAHLDAGGYGVDFGGIAKGYGVDRAIEAMKAAGVASAIVDAGGDLFAAGRPQADRLWRVGIRDPHHTDRIFAKFDIEDEAVATSGTYLQKRIVDGREISHLIDPRTGNSVNHVISATVIAPDAMTADALATAACVLPTDQCRSLFDSLPGIEALWVSPDGQVTMTEGMRRRVELV